MDLDLDTARAAFEDSTDFTVGIEEEFALLDATDLGLVARFDELRQRPQRRTRCSPPRWPGS